MRVIGTITLPKRQGYGSFVCGKVMVPKIKCTINLITSCPKNDKNELHCYKGI